MRLDHLLSREPVYLTSLLGWGVVVLFVPVCGAQDARRIFVEALIESDVTETVAG